MRALPRWLCILLVPCAFVAACTRSGSGQPQTTRSGRCPERLGFRATYVPPGFEAAMHVGPPPGRTTFGKAALFYFRGSGGRYIEIARGGLRHPFQSRTVVAVLGSAGRVATVSGVVAVKFRLGPGHCELYGIEGVGVAEPELVRFAGGLRAGP